MTESFAKMGLTCKKIGKLGAVLSAAAYFVIDDNPIVLVPIIISTLIYAYGAFADYKILKGFDEYAAYKARTEESIKGINNIYSNKDMDEL
ncbi:hypothetical protein KY312_02595 [Candidatus Woesearchaeota archaeon]|nr:hypothetical protein [Candidatus Woesearchaeota archaeon]